MIQNGDGLEEKAGTACCYIMLCHVKSCCVMLCYFTLYYVMICYVMLSYEIYGPGSRVWTYLLWDIFQSESKSFFTSIVPVI
jgi:hypothetical protein